MKYIELPNKIFIMYMSIDNESLDIDIIKEFILKGDMDPQYKWYDDYNQENFFYIEIFSKEELPLEDIDSPYIAARLFQLTEEDGKQKLHSYTFTNEHAERKDRHKIFVQKGSFLKK